MILFTHEFSPFRGGAATYVQETAAAAARLGIPVEVWTADYRQPAAHWREADAAWSFPVVRLPSGGRLSPAGIGGLMWGLYRRRERLRAEPTVLLSVGAHMAWALLAGLHLLPANARAVCFFHGSEVLKFREPSRWQPWMRRLYARSAGFAVASRYVQRLVGESGLLPAEAEIALAPCACPTALLPVMSPRQPAASVAAAGREDDTVAANAKLRVLTVARLHPRKGQLELAQALAALPADVRGRVIYQLVGVGEESYRAQVEAVCCADGVACEFLGGLDDAALREVYARCDIYAQASRTLARSVEGFGISFLEASQHGKPIVAVETGGVTEAVLDGQTGLLVPEGDPRALTAALARLAQDTALRRKLGEDGQSHAARFSWEESARVLQRLCGSTGSR